MSSISPLHQRHHNHHQLKKKSRVNRRICNKSKSSKEPLHLLLPPQNKCKGSRWKFSKVSSRVIV